MLDDGTPLSSVTGELPYLLKVLAAARPLSLQTHPDADQARRMQMQAKIRTQVLGDPSNANANWKQNSQKVLFCIPVYCTVI